VLATGTTGRGRAKGSIDELPSGSLEVRVTPARIH
jgi:hypothetical protein